MLGLLQGVSELFPISSLGHSVILPNLLGWNIHQNEPYFLTFLVALHLATALVLLGFFWRRLGADRQGARPLAARPGDHRPRREARLAARRRRRSPPGSSGCCCQDSLRKLFASPEYASIFLALNGVMLFGAEAAAAAGSRRRPRTTTSGSRRRWAGGSPSPSARPSRSRSSRASRARARRWAAGCSSGSRTRTPRASPSCSRRRSSSPRPSSSCPTSPARRATACAARRSSARSARRSRAYLSVRFLMRYFETRTLTPFAIYCLCAGTACAIYFAVT